MDNDYLACEFLDQCRREFPGKRNEERRKRCDCIVCLGCKHYWAICAKNRFKEEEGGRGRNVRQHFADNKKDARSG